MRKVIYIAALISMLAISCLVCFGCGQAVSGQRGDDVRGVPLATVNDEPVMSETFREGYLGYLLKTGLQDKPEYRRHFMESMIASVLLVQEARTSGIEDEKAYQKAYDRIVKKLLVDIYVRKALFDALEVTEEDLKDMFVRANTTLTARHLYAPTLVEANALYERLNTGASFEALAREVFADTTLANNGGLIGDFTLDDMDVAFEEAAYQLQVGEISKPVKTSQGYSIIKLEDRFTKPLITEFEYAERRDRMLQFVLFRKKTKARKVHAEELLEDVSPTYNTEAVERLYGLIAGNPSIDNDEKRAVWMDEPLVSFTGAEGAVEWTPRTFQAFASETSAEQRARVRTEEDLKSFIDALVVREEMAQRSINLGLEEDPEFEYELEKAMHNWIWSQSVDAIVEELVLSPDSLNAYYRANKANFLPPPEVDVSEILVDSKERAQEALDKLQTEVFESVARAYSIRPGAEETGGRLGYLRPGQMGIMWNYISDAGEGDVIGPIEVDGHFVLLKVGSRKASTLNGNPPPLKDIKAQYLIQHKDRLVVEHVAALREASGISIDYALLDTLEIKASKSIPEYKTN